jgi:hypothetical protein
MGHETTIDGCIAAGPAHFVPVVRNWFNMWNSHVVERLILFLECLCFRIDINLASTHVMICLNLASTTYLAVSLHMDARLGACREFKPPRNPLY